MKHLTLIFAMLLSVASMAQTPKGKNCARSIEPKNERVEYLMYLDSVNRAIMGDPYDIDDIKLRAFAEMRDKPTTPEQIRKEMFKTYDDVAKKWQTFVNLCNKGKDKKAITYYRDNRINIDIHLSYTAVRLAFHDDVIGVMAFDNLPPEEAANLLIDALEFDHAMIEVNYSSTSGEDYVGMYEYVFELLNILYEATQRYDDRFALIDRWAEKTGMIARGAPYEAEVKMRKAQVYYSMDDLENALKLLHEAKSLLESAIAAGNHDNYPERGIEVITRVINQINEEINAR